MTSDRLRYKICHMAKIAALALLLALLLGISLTATASPDELRWTRVDTPGEGRSGGWVLVPDSDIRYLAAASDGTLYAYGRGTDHTLYRSIDSGTSWEAIEEAKDTIVALATSPTDEDIIGYATEAEVFCSTDGGGEFVKLAGNPGSAGDGNIAITSIAITTTDDGNVMAAATMDNDDGSFGGVYIYDERQSSPVWQDAQVGDYDAFAVAFSPDYATDSQLVAVVTDETNTLVTTKIGTAAWGQTTGNATLENSGEPVAVATSAAIAFPDDYDVSSRYVHFVAIDTGEEEGDVYTITGRQSPTPSTALDLNIGTEYGLASVDITSLAASGRADSAQLTAGAASSAETYFSTDGGESWERSTKPPTGETKTYVVLDSDDRAYAATSGHGSAVSITRDGGLTWNQSGLIDTEISSMVDQAPSPEYSRDETLFLLTWGGGHSLWRSTNSGESWERVYSADHAGVDEIDRVALPADYDKSNQTVFLAGSGNGQPTIWYSKDNGQEFTGHETPLPIDTWAVAGDRTLFIGGYDGTNGRVCRSTNGGRSYSASAVAGDQPLHSIALSPEYEDDESLLIGNSNGWVFLSEDNGQTFTPLPEGAATAPLTGSIVVAFDPSCRRNHTVYAASDTPDSGIYRLRWDKEASWESIDSALPAGGMIGQLKLATGGALYATNFTAGGGLERCIEPTDNPSPTFETVTQGLDDGATLVGLWIVNNQLWSIDTTSHRLLSYRDSLAVPVELTSPEDEASGVGTINKDSVSQVSLEWYSLPGATRYRWQLNYDSDFASIPDGFEGESHGTSTHLPALDPATRHYWRVRAIQPVLSPWSDTWSFSTSSLVTGIATPQPYRPKDGASEVNLRPVFRWSSIDGADSYELLVATDADFKNKVVSKTGNQALTTNTWECDTDLSPGTTYFWKVRAKGQGSYSDWSDAYTFTTASTSPATSPVTPPATLPATPTAEQSSPAPAPPPKPDTDWTQWLVIIGTALLITMLAILVTLIVLAIRMRRI